MPPDTLVGHPQILASEYNIHLRSHYLLEGMKRLSYFIGKEPLFWSVSVPKRDFPQWLFIDLLCTRSLLQRNTHRVHWVPLSQSRSVVSNLCDPMDCSPPGSSLRRILWTGILEWVAIPFSRGSSQHRDQTQVSYIEGRFFVIWVTCIENLP